VLPRGKDYSKLHSRSVDANLAKGVVRLKGLPSVESKAGKDSKL